MLDIQIESAGTIAQFDALIANISGLQDKLPQEFLAWQRDDMNRKYPTISAWGVGMVETKIYPRSRIVRDPKYRYKRSRRRRFHIAGRTITAPRPILRAELYDKLRERMREMLKDAATWQ